ncbi:MAG: TRAP transporter small permease [Deltaproteobacteria bacterium]|nr:TRAP transporter small permease [Deltaproteobacteria bacterium]
MFPRILKAIDVGFKNVLSIVHRISWIMLVLLMILGTADVLGRYFLNRPITGAREISSILVVGIVVLSWAYVQSKKGHLTIDFVVFQLPHIAQVAAELIVLLISLAVFGTIAWQSGNIAIRCWEIGYLVPTVQIPLAPFQLLVTFGAFILCLEYIYEIICLFYDLSKKGGLR